MSIGRSDSIDLSGLWTLTSDDGLHEVPMPLPGDALSALLDAGVIPDPYADENELAVRWVAEADWTARRSFEIPADLSGRPVALVLDGVDTVVDVSVNGRPALSADTMFRPHRADVTALLRPGENEIAIAFRSNVRAAADRAARQPFEIPYIVQNQPIPHTNLLRKVQCHAGWDWNLAVMPFGLYGEAKLVAADAAEIVYVQHRQQHGAPGEAVRVVVSAVVDAPAAFDGTIAVDLEGRVAARHLSFHAGRQTVELTVAVDSPELWWPAGLGPQRLYDLTVSVAGTEKRQRIGLRRLAIDTRRDAIGVPLTVVVNDHPVFCRGANWIPTDALPSRITPEATRPLLEAAVAANMNMIRVWGGGQYEPDWFYDLCDELGLLVWQDMMFSCSLYPADEAFLAEIDREIEHQVRRIASHPCVALWCGDNEVIGALTWFEVSRNNRDRYLVAYDRLNRTIETAVRRADPDRLFWPSSPSKGPLDFGDGWKAEGSGDLHMWEVWHGAKDFEHYRSVRPRFASEFGFQSFPSLATLSAYIAEDALDISSPAMDLHQKNAGGNARIVETIARYFRFPKDYAGLIYLSQYQQGLAMKTAVDFWRSLKPECMGTLYWQLNDTYPVASWSSLEYGGRWKLLHHMARRFFAPVNVVAIPDDDGTTVRLVGVNDRRETVAIGGEAFWLAMDGTRTPAGRFAADLPVDRAVPLLEVPAPGTGEEVLVFRWTDGRETSTDHLVVGRPKRLPLQDARLTVTTAATADGRFAFTVAATRPAFGVTLETKVAGTFSDNAFMVLPGEPVTIDFDARGGEDPRPSLTVSDLWSSFRPNSARVVA